MKKRLIFIYILIVFSIYGMEERYKELNFYNKTVYFPYSISEKIETYLEDENLESYEKLIDIYIKLGKNSAAKYYYEDYKTKSENYLTLASFAHRLNFYKEEIRFIKEYLKDRDLKEKKKYYTYILELIKTNNIDINEDEYRIKKIDELFSLTDNEKEFMKFYENRVWDVKEIREIKDRIKKYIEKEGYLEIYLALVDENEKIGYYKEKIRDLEDKENYFVYFSKMEEFKRKIKLKDDFEKLYYLEYKEEFEEYENYYKEIKEKYFENKNQKALKILYNMKKDFEILYNLALADEEYMYKLILNYDSYKDILIEKEDLLSEFNARYPQSRLKRNLELIALANKSDQSKIEIYDRLLSEKYDEIIFRKKIELLEKMGKNEDLQYELENYIYKIYPLEFYIKKYIKLMNENNKSEELLSKLETLSDKTYYFNELEKMNKVIPGKYYKEAIEIYSEKEDYTKLYIYRDSMSKEQLREIIGKTGDKRFINFAKKKFDFERDWMDLDKYANLYFNFEFKDFDLEKVEKVIVKEDRTDFEIYYLARYYYSIGDYKRSEEVLDDIYERYKIEEEILEFKDKIEKGKIRKAEIEFENKFKI